MFTTMLCYDNMSVCIGDTSEMCMLTNYFRSLVVRRTTLTTIINLLQEDYLKLTGNLFFRILQTLSDESEEILNLTTFYIQQRLLKRKPKVMYSHFIEAIFHFNEYKVILTYFYHKKSLLKS